MTKGVPCAPATSARQCPTVQVVDDDLRTRDALSSLFRSVGLGVQAFASAEDLLKYPIPSAPSCLVLDIILPKLNGFELQVELDRLGNRIPIIFMTGYGDIPMSVKAMKAGAIDFLTKPLRDHQMLEAVTRALDRDQRRRTEERRAEQIKSRFDTLTEREREVMSLVTAGLMNKQVASEIGISERTVKIHRGHVMRKMGTESLADLVLIAESLGVRWRKRNAST